ncbi:hypothetical protein SODALDRAFT_156262 [Sodiomyces alkalinus F11]|uniref:Uncharacterized protein n=1 Tax=Sodiomyces alkalinus (strain CBS 110278 / VKM F-3762 / F11) TaxID=1314773 RepID=A0A3N2PXZ7_SODAK|nr:hypothetical protein SODALDRAFT_156262 [Sodiomyces alkalinus F11]ROT39286.1 hypothetical protein SODALDRAFT_156262 [Sodiomyces alkalinus F11]
MHLVASSAFFPLYVKFHCKPCLTTSALHLTLLGTAAGMAPLIKVPQVIDTCVAFGTVSIFEGFYCWYLYAHKIPCQTLVRVACALNIPGSVFLALFLIFWQHGPAVPAYAMMVLCTSTSVASIWCFEVLEVLRPISKIWLDDFNVPLFNTGLRESVFWALCCCYAALGLWQLAAYQVEILWAFPLLTHITVVAAVARGLILFLQNRNKKQAKLL